MKKTEIILIALGSVSALLKILGIPGMSILMVLSAFSLMMFYLFFSVGILNDLTFKQIFQIKSYEKVNSLKVVGSVLLGLVFCFSVLSFVFELMFWRGAGLILIFSLVQLILGGAIILLCKKRFDEKLFALRVKRIVFFIAISLVLKSIPFEVLVRLQYKDTEYAEAFIKCVGEENDCEEYDKMIKQRSGIK